jgi:protein-disulfide isomerase
MPILIRHGFKAVFMMILFGLVPLVLFAETSSTDDYKDMVKGINGSEITVVEYASFTCPHCATFHKEVFPKIEKEYIKTGKVRFIYREVYFDAPGLWAGLLARCADPKKYFGIVDLLYKKQSKWATGSSEKEVLSELFAIGRQVGLEEERMNACMQNEDKSLSMIDAYLKNSKLDQIESTPSLVVNGKLLKTANFADLKSELDRLLN